MTRQTAGIEPQPPNPVQRADRPLDQPSTRRLAPDHPHRDAIIDTHRAALAAGEDGYIDPVTGRYVFTAARLLANGACCNSGCRHCPWHR